MMCGHQVCKRRLARAVLGFAGVDENPDVSFPTQTDFRPEAVPEVIC